MINQSWLQSWKPKLFLADQLVTKKATKNLGHFYPNLLKNITYIIILLITGSKKLKSTSNERLITANLDEEETVRLHVIKKTRFMPKSKAVNNFKIIIITNTIPAKQINWIRLIYYNYFLITGFARPAFWKARASSFLKSSSVIVFFGQSAIRYFQVALEKCYCLRKTSNNCLKY